MTVEERLTALEKQVARLDRRTIGSVRFGPGPRGLPQKRDIRKPLADLIREASEHLQKERICVTEAQGKTE